MRIVHRRLKHHASPPSTIPRSLSLSADAMDARLLPHSLRPSRFLLIALANSSYLDAAINKPGNIVNCTEILPVDWREHHPPPFTRTTTTTTTASVMTGSIIIKETRRTIAFSNRLNADKLSLPTPASRGKTQPLVLRLIVTGIYIGCWC